LKRIFLRSSFIVKEKREREREKSVKRARSKRRERDQSLNSRVPVETLVSAPMTIPPSYSHATMVVPVFGASSFPEEEKDGTLGSIKSALWAVFREKK